MSTLGLIYFTDELISIACLFPAYGTKKDAAIDEITGKGCAL
jgi:hypothetical protein